MYEIHITAFEYPEKDNIEKFKKFNKEVMSETKTLLIALSSGKYPMQLMATVKALDVSENEIILDSEILNKIYSSSFPVVRLKVESSDMEGDYVYYEAHWKIVKPLQSTCRKLVKDFYKDQGFHYSWNMLTEKVHWLTSRAYKCSPRAAINLFDDQARILEEDHVVATHHYERVIIDTNKGLDFGWTEKGSSL